MSSIHNAINTLRNDVRALKQFDEIPDGTIIKFTWKGSYDYAVIKTAGSFYSTATRNGFIPNTMDYAKLLEILSSSSVTNVAIATEFQPL